MRLTDQGAKGKGGAPKGDGLTKPIFTTLDALRGAAAVIVVVYHAGTSRVPGGYLAVDLFFTLSGFVLAHNYGDALHGWRDAGRFFVRRLVRLYPLYGLALAFGFAVHLAITLSEGGFWPSRALASLGANALFAPAAPAFSPTAHPYPFNPPAWSLFFELGINGVFALAAPFLRSWRLLIAFVGLGAVSLAWASVAHGDLNGGARFSGFAVGAARVLFSFFTGVALHRLWAAGRLRLRLSPWIVVAGFLALVLAPASEPWVALRDLVIVLVLLPLLVAASTDGRPSALLGYLGRISFALYVIHTPVLYLLNQAGEAVAGLRVREMGPAGPALLLAASLPAAAVLDRLDGPLRRWLLSRLPPWACRPSGARPDAHSPKASLQG